ncbi:MAG: DNA repair protein RecN [Planctomycetes bacterium]|nr:DNA repair protein RecN [Planctomycetota bacterium]
MVELSIRDLALFEDTTFSFGGGLNCITGETGAGKSLFIGALKLLLGERPKGKLVREGASEARVEGLFQFGAEEIPRRLRELLTEHAPEILEELSGDEDLELVLVRRLRADGKTQGKLNGQVVTQRLLRTLSSSLVEIHGQHEGQSLFEAREQVALLDAYGGHDELVETYRALRAEWSRLVDALTSFEEGARSRTDRLDLVRFQSSELEEAGLSVEAGRELGEERERLRHAEELLREVGGALEGLDGEEGSAIARVHAGLAALERWEVKIADLSEPAEALREASLHLSEASESLARFVGGVEVSPGRLEEVEGRLAGYERLAKKHGTDLPGLVALQARLAEELAELEGGAGSTEELEAELRAALERMSEAAAALTKERRSLRKKLKDSVEASLKDLGLERAEFGVSVEERAQVTSDSPNSGPQGDRRFGLDGADEVAFQLAANPGEGLSPLSEVASGGEAARILLALRGALAAKQTIPTLIFDEIDSGVGGRVAPRVGAHLRALGEHHQILCVTHLPAVAAAAHRHLRVEKRTEEGRTRTWVQELAPEARVFEVADMISGGADADTAQAEARRLLLEAVE